MSKKALNQSVAKLGRDYRNVDLVKVEELLEKIPRLDEDKLAALPPYKTEKQTRIFFQSNLVRQVYAAKVGERRATRYIFTSYVFPRGSGTASHPVSVLWDGAELLAFSCDCAMG